MQYCASVQYHAIPCNTMQYHVIPSNTIQYHPIPCNTMQYHPRPYTTMQYHASLITADRSYHCTVGSIRPFFDPVLYSSSDDLVLHYSYLIPLLPWAVGSWKSQFTCKRLLPTTIKLLIFDLTGTPALALAGTSNSRNRSNRRRILDIAFNSKLKSCFGHKIKALIWRIFLPSEKALIKSFCTKDL